MDPVKHIGQFTRVLALYDPFGVDVPLNFDFLSLTHQLAVGDMTMSSGTPTKSLIHPTPQPRDSGFLTQKVKTKGKRGPNSFVWKLSRDSNFNVVCLTQMEFDR